MSFTVATKFEYKVVAIPYEQLEKRLNVLGSQGWELVAATSDHWYFKRRKTS